MLSSQESIAARSCELSAHQELKIPAARVSSNQVSSIVTLQRSTEIILRASKRSRPNSDLHNPAEVAKALQHHPGKSSDDGRIIHYSSIVADLISSHEMLLNQNSQSSQLKSRVDKIYNSKVYTDSIRAAGKLPKTLSVQQDPAGEVKQSLSAIHSNAAAIADRLKSEDLRLDTQEEKNFIKELMKTAFKYSNSFSQDSSKAPAERLSALIQSGSIPEEHLNVLASSLSIRKLLSVGLSNSEVNWKSWHTASGSSKIIVAEGKKTAESRAIELILAGTSRSKSLDNGWTMKEYTMGKKGRMLTASKEGVSVVTFFDHSHINKDNHITNDYISLSEAALKNLGYIAK